MTREELLQLIAEVQKYQCELDDVEVKIALRGTPQRLFAALSAFANRPGGGAILFGLDESRDFEVVGVGDVQRLQSDVVDIASAQMEPPLRLDIAVEQVDGKNVAVVEVPEVAPHQKPCFYKTAGLQRGSYIRVGNSNRQMTDYEVFGYVSSRTPPSFDEEVVPGALLEDLDKARLERYLASFRQSRPQSPLLRLPDAQLLARLRVLREGDGALRPTLAGLFAFGQYPQQFEPQLVITFLHYFGATETEPTPRGERFLDNRKFEGPIPDMVEAAVKHVLASLRKSSLIEGLWRRDIPEYPEEAVREAVVNAVVHRDYSPYARGSYVQIRLFADRLEIQSPGGLFGNVTVERLEEEQSTRNRVLMRLMEDIRLAENRGSGIRAMIGAMRRANLEPPRFRDDRSSFLVTFRNHTLMSPDAVTWLNRFAAVPMSDHQRLALVYLRDNEQMVSADYQRLNRVDPVAAGRDLRSLVQMGLVEQHGTRRWAYYTLASEPPRTQGEKAESDEGRILAYVKEHGSIGNAECRALLGVGADRAWYLLKKLRSAGRLTQVGDKRAARYLLA